MKRFLSPKYQLKFSLLALLRILEVAVFLSRTRSLSPISSAAKQSGLYFDTKKENNTISITTSGSFSKFASIIVKLNNLTGNEVGEIPNATKSDAFASFTESGYVCRDN